MAPPAGHTVTFEPIYSELVAALKHRGLETRAQLGPTRAGALSGALSGALPSSGIMGTPVAPPLDATCPDAPVLFSFPLTGGSAPVAR